MMAKKADPKTSSAAGDRESAKRLGELLDQIARVRRVEEYPPRLEAARQFVEALPASQVLGVISGAMGKGIRRFRTAASVLAQCRASDEIDAWFRAGFADAAAERREWMAQVVGQLRLVRFADEVNRLFADSACRDFAIIAAGDLATPASHDALVKHARTLKGKTIPMNLLQALAKCASSEARPFLAAAFARPENDHYQVFAAWGLGRLKDPAALAHLEKALDDEDDGRPSLVARRAAQALSDLHGWSLEWTPEAPREAKRRLASRKR